jgi:hypothetical protein
MYYIVIIYIGISEERKKLFFYDDYILLRMLYVFYLFEINILCKLLEIKVRIIIMIIISSFFKYFLC